MMLEPTLPSQLIPFLGELGINTQEVLRSRPLHSGQSGASTCWLDLKGGGAVLKVAPASSSSIVRKRAQRELNFYRDVAATQPLRVPQLRASYQGPKGVALLLEALESSPAPETWSHNDFLGAVTQLAELHTASWADPALLTRHPWLERPTDRDAEVKAARSAWHKLYETPRFAQVLTARELAWLDSLLDKANDVQALIETLPPTLCHGDCTTLNILLSKSGELVWTDWQEVRSGRGPEDLAFLLERASVSGARVSYTALLSAYRDRLEQPVTLAAIERVVRAAELRSRVLYWPAYLTGATQSQLSSMLERVHSLTKALGFTVQPQG